MDKNNSSQDHLWEPCPKGMLLKVAELCSEKNHSSLDHQWEPCPQGMLLKVAERCAEKNNSNQDHLWEPCPQGMLLQVADRSSEQIRERKSQTGSGQFDRRQLLKIAAAVAVTTGAGVIGYQSLYPSVPSKGYGGISCATFRKNMDKYIQKGLEDQQLVAKMDKHLELCKGCKARYDRKQTA